MKPTDEAKRLREEIVLTISNSEPFTSEYFDDLDYKLIGSIAEKSINKVLDAAVIVAENKRLENVEDDDPADMAYEDAIDSVMRAINRLRP